MSITPNKRKRESFGGGVASVNKENYGYNQGFMEVKSLADIRLPVQSTNPFEVVRKPPKKKTKCEFIEENCFVNPALNLNGPENVINPFEIRRTAPIVTSRNAVDPHCFYNTGLNIRGPEKEVRNPFEIVRPTQANEGMENAGLNVHSPLISRAIAIPFTPTIGCRINFTDVPLESLTPCSMLAKKLVFSPAPPNKHTFPINDTPKKITERAQAVDDVELSVISEESLDIIAELDCYQLELENSINEAKINKKKRRSSAGRSKNLMDLKNRKSFALLLNQDEDGRNTKEDTPKMKPVVSDTNLATQLTPKIDTITETQIEMPQNTDPVSKDSSSVDFEEVDDDLIDNFDFKNPAPFVRTFKRKSVRKPTPLAIHKSAESLPEPNTGKQKSIGSSIRSSIRRILKPNPKKTLSSDDLNENVANTENHTGSSSNLFASIRQSLRRKPSTKTNLFVEPKNMDHELSILVDTDRKVFRQTSSDKFNPIHSSTRSHEDLGEFVKKSSLRKSVRNTGKDVGRHVMKTMFKKNTEGYTFEQ